MLWNMTVIGNKILFITTMSEVPPLKTHRKIHAVGNISMPCGGCYHASGIKSILRVKVCTQ
jgi:hypothetical protein